MGSIAIRGGAEILALAVCVAVASGQEAVKQDTVSVTQFGRSNVIGHLGKPLGTLVRVTGVAIDGDSLRLKKYSGQTLLQVETVDGRGLERRAPYFLFQRAAKEILMPLAGQRFDYIVHEWGAFDGVVQLPGEPAVANDGFYYHAGIAIHKDHGEAK